jgi:hypothetical protein
MGKLDGAHAFGNVLLCHPIHFPEMIDSGTRIVTGVNQDAKSGNVGFSLMISLHFGLARACLGQKQSLVVPQAQMGQFMG